MYNKTLITWLNFGLDLKNSYSTANVAIDSGLYRDPATKFFCSPKYPVNDSLQKISVIPSKPFFTNLFSEATMISSNA